MGKTTNNTFADSAVSPVAGCDGCRLYPTADIVIKELANLLEPFGCVPASVVADLKGLTGTELYHRRHEIAERWSVRSNTESGHAADMIEGMIAAEFRCTAGRLHLHFGLNSTKPDKRARPGYAPTFKHPTMYSGRMELATRWNDLSGTARPARPWLDDQPRIIAISESGEALSEGISFEFLHDEIIANVRSEHGRRHIWVWSTNKPRRLVEFARWLATHGIQWPVNLIPMATVMNRDDDRSHEELKHIPGAIRAVRVEPILGPVNLDLEGFQWIVCGGETGVRAPAFHLNWIRDLHEQAGDAQAAFFVSRLGRRHMDDDGDGDYALFWQPGDGIDWSTWPEDVRVRELPSILPQLVGHEENPTVSASLTRLPKDLLAPALRAVETLSQNPATSEAQLFADISGHQSGTSAVSPSTGTDDPDDPLDLHEALPGCFSVSFDTICEHEAAHAAMRWFRGLQSTRVTANESGGYCYGTGDSCRLDDHIFVSLAGYAWEFYQAEAVLISTANINDPDFNNARESILRYHMLSGPGQPEDMERELRGWFRDVQREVRDLGHIIKPLARKLMERRDLSAEEVEAIIQKADKGAQRKQAKTD